MRQHEKDRILEIFKTLSEAHAVIKDYIVKDDFANAHGLLADCQQTAVGIGEFIENIEGETCLSVRRLEDYCERLYQISEDASKGLFSKQAVQMLDDSLEEMESSLETDIAIRLEVVFLPYKASMWDSLESVWKAADEDPACDAYVIPIPYYDKNPDGSFCQEHYEGDLYPDYVPITRYDEYDFQNRQPDMIFIHNPYDDCNYVTSVHPAFYSRVLKAYTKNLVYIPYFLFPKVPKAHLINTPVLQNADYIVVQNERTRNAYVREIERYVGANKILQNNVLALGTPKTDKIYHICNNGISIPKQWITQAQNKKKMLLNTNISLILNNDENFIDNLHRVFEILNKRQDVFVIWREHPLTDGTLRAMCPGMIDAYKKLKIEFIKSGLGVLDTNIEAHAAMYFSDCYFGAGGSLVPLYAVTGKPMLVTAYRYPDNIINQEASFSALMKQSESNIFFSERYVNFLDLFLDNLEIIAKDKVKRLNLLSQITFNVDGTVGSKIMKGVKALMQRKMMAKNLFRDYIKETFHDEAENLDLYIFGLELQICGGILKFEDELDITLMSFDLRFTGYQYSGHVCMLPEMCVPFPDNAAVLVSCIYPYQFEEIKTKLVGLGIREESIVHARSIAEKILDKSGSFYSQNAMDSKVKMLFEGIGKDLSEIRYIDIGANTWLLYNNSYLFYRAGASGVLVEANPDFVEVIKGNRPRDKAIMCGCSDVRTDEKWTYYKTSHAGYNTFVKSIADQYVKKGIAVEEIKIPMKDIGSILDENFPSGHIDYMSVDVEGMGVRIVNAIDFDRYRIDVMLLEMDFNQEESRKLYMKLLDLGYTSRYRGIGAGKDFLFFRTDVFGSDIL